MLKAEKQQQINNARKESRRGFLRSCLHLAASALAGATGLSVLAPARQTALPSSSGDRPSGDALTFDAPLEPGYVELHRSGELKKRGDALWEIMKECRLCPRECGVNRLEGKKGFCQSTSKLKIASYHPHFGEERPLVGTGGSGTIFFSGCGLRCVFCINWEVSQGGYGEERSIEELAAMMLDLRDMGCHNINVVTPTHYSPHIVLGLDIAAKKGLRLPLVYNTCGWERLEIVRLLDGVVDIYLPDFKYADSSMADKYSSGAQTYPEITQQGLVEMHRQVGVAKPAEDDLMYRGLMIRHLVMPNDVGGTHDVLGWIAENLPEDSYLNIMSQYRPMYKAFDYPDISRRLTRLEYTQAVQRARELGLTNLDIQGQP